MAPSWYHLTTVQIPNLPYELSHLVKSSLSFFLSITFNLLSFLYLGQIGDFRSSYFFVAIQSCCQHYFFDVTWYGDQSWLRLLDSYWPINRYPKGGYVAFPANVEVDDVTGEITKELEDPDLLQNRPPFQRALVISGIYPSIHRSIDRSLSNPILSYSYLSYPKLP